MVKDLAWVVLAGVVMPTMVVAWLRRLGQMKDRAPLHADARDVARMDANKG
jgi:hypothetical protein